MITDLIKKLITFIKIKCNHVSSEGGNYIGLDVKIVNRGKIVFGKDVIIRPSTGLYTNPGIMLSIGSNTEIGNHSTIAAHHKVIIGNGGLTGPHVFIADYNHEYRDVYKNVLEQGEFAPENSQVIIGEGSWLGTNVVIVGNVRVGKHCVIGANSVVTKNIPDYSVAAGIPAKVIKQYDFESNKWVKVNSKT